MAEDGPPVVWKKRIGTGYSAPSVLANGWSSHHRPKDEEIVECFDAVTGEPLWKYAYDTDFSDPTATTTARAARRC